ncbi:MAG: DoxX family protein [Mycobacterium sp.]|jgi:hypothetical protein|uniref:DoxX family protein n=1 Tax=Mycobacterium sp. TaxID=1785 RepID=UPI0028420FC1|nr:DoxX family protein [Mycobacterium sp.]HKI43272.1 DoxX family protein [Mycobacterium sp.]
MHLAATILSVLLALLMAATGSMKVLNTSTAQKNSRHLGYSTGLSRLIGLAELAATAGLLIGIAWHPLTLVTAAAVVALMVGAVTYHVRAGDDARALAPAVITAAAAGALVILSIPR